MESETFYCSLTYTFCRRPAPFSDVVLLCHWLGGSQGSEGPGWVVSTIGIWSWQHGVLSYFLRLQPPCYGCELGAWDFLSKPTYLAGLQETYIIVRWRPSCFLLHCEAHKLHLHMKILLSMFLASAQT